MKRESLPERFLQFICLPLLFSLLINGSLLGQGAAELEGQVFDQEGAVLPGVTVTATNESTGIERIAVTSAQGVYRFPPLLPGLYKVTAQLEGFNTQTLTDVRLNVASTRSIDFSLSIAAISEEIVTVADAAPLIAESPSIGTVISQEELEKLPLNGRQFASLGTLAAGTTLDYNSDPTKPGQQVISVAGGSGRNVNYMIDGGDNMDDTIGGALQNFSIEGVQEFRLQTQQYKAEFGRSTGAVLSVITKSGTNNFDGSVFGFARDDELNSQTETEKRAGAEKAPFSRDQYGASLGGPILRDKAHFFATVERTERDGFVTTNTNGLFPNFDGQTVSTPFEDELITVKATVDINPKQFLQVRYGYQENTDKYNAIPTATPDNFGTLKNEATTILVGHTTQIGRNSFNEFTAQYSEFENLITSDSENPTIYFPGGVVTGQNGNTPQGTVQEKRQFKNDFSFAREFGGDRHEFKVGVEYIDEPLLGGDFPTGLNGLFTALEDRPGSPITDITFNAGSFNFSTPNEQYRIYFQDDWQVNDRLALNLGLRYEYTDILELDQTGNAIWQTLSTQTTFNEFYLLDFQNGGGAQLDPSDDDFAPRLGFSYDMKGDGKQILRGGWGLFYDFPYTNATVLFPAAAVQSEFGVAFNHNNPTGILNEDGTFFQPGDPLPPNQVGGAGTAPAPNEVASPTLSTPYATQVSVGYSHQLNPWLGLTVDAVSVRYRSLPFRFRANPLTTDTDGDGVLDQRRFPDFGNFRLWYGKGRAEYDALNLTFRGRLSEKFEFQAFYTLSRTEGNTLAGSDEFRITDANHQPELGGSARDASPDPLNPLCDRCIGPLNTDARHRVTLSGVYRGPYGIDISGILRYRSALPYTAHQGFDANGDGFNFDLLPGESVNDRRGSSFTQIDIRISKVFQFTEEHSLELIGEIFNLLNDENPDGFVGAQNANNFGQPTTFAGDQLQGEQRLGQIGLRFRF